MCPFLASTLACLAVLGSAPVATAMFWRDDNQTPPNLPPGTNSGWKAFTSPFYLENGIYLGFPSTQTDDVMSLTLAVEGTNLGFDDPDFSGSQVGGTGNTLTGERRSGELYGGTYIARGVFNIHPSGVWVHLVPTSVTPAPKITGTIWYWRDVKGHVNFGTTCDFKYTEGSTKDPPLRTEYWFFPDDVPIDTSQTPTFVGPPGSGNWSYQYLYSDPYGNPMPNGGIEWTTNGAGVSDGQEVDTSFDCVAPGNVLYTDYEVFADGTTVPFTEVCPEPASAGMIALSAVGLLARRRQRA